MDKIVKYFFIIIIVSFLFYFSFNCIDNFLNVKKSQSREPKNLYGSNKPHEDKFNKIKNDLGNKIQINKPNNKPENKKIKSKLQIDDEEYENIHKKLYDRLHFELSNALMLTNSSVSPANSSIGPANSSIGPANSSIGPANSSIRPANSSISPANSSVGPANSSVIPKAFSSNISSK